MLALDVDGCGDTTLLECASVRRAVQQQAVLFCVCVKAGMRLAGGLWGQAEGSVHSHKRAAAHHEQHSRVSDHVSFNDLITKRSN